MRLSGIFDGLRITYLGERAGYECRRNVGGTMHMYRFKNGRYVYQGCYRPARDIDCGECPIDGVGYAGELP